MIPKEKEQGPCKGLYKASRTNGGRCCSVQKGEGQKQKVRKNKAPENQMATAEPQAHLGSTQRSKQQQLLG